jgi:tetratricopeptide (TPR) repeat protein
LPATALSYLAREHDEAIALIDTALQLNPSSAGARTSGGWVRCYRSEPEEYLAMAYVELGQLEAAREAIRHLLECDPTLTVARQRLRMPLVGTLGERYLAALRVADLPEG